MSKNLTILNLKANPWIQEAHVPSGMNESKSILR
jgi:hypothetical protein